MVNDLDKAAENYKRLGFTVSPRGTHSAHMGSGNYTIMFDPDYMELLGVLRPTEHNEPARAFLEKNGEGIERIAFTAVDSARGAEEILARGYIPVGPTDFERPVTLPDGTESAARFRTFQWPTVEAPAGVRIFACQHKTRETVWIPELMKHANGARRLKQVLMVAPEPAKDAAHMSKLIDRDVRNESDGAIAVPSGGDRADFVFLTKDQLGKRYPGVSLAGLPERGGAALECVEDDHLQMVALARGLADRCVPDPGLTDAADIRHRTTGHPLQTSRRSLRRSAAGRVRQGADRGHLGMHLEYRIRRD